MRGIVLSNGMVTLVDDEDYADLIEFKWQGVRNARGDYYATTSWRREGCEPVTIYLARWLMGVVDDPKVVVDHINHNTLDNRKQNLRVCTQSENLRNRRIKVPA
jgi:hypothetical protein